MVKCAQCGKEHSPAELELSFLRPDVVHQMPEEQRKSDIKESNEYCRIGKERFFLRGVLPLSVSGREAPYRIGAWVEVDEKTYARVAELWDEPTQGEEPPFQAVLANAIPLLPTTLGLPVLLQLTGATTRPDIFVQESVHPLYAEQVGGISEHRAYEYSECV